MASIGAKLCKVVVQVLVDSAPNMSHRVVIDGANYYHGDTALLTIGLHTLTWISGNGGYFSTWGTSGLISVANPNAESTTLTVLGDGTLTLNLLLHPSYVCWYNSCEDLTEWDIDAGIAASINVTDFKEGSGSLDLTLSSGVVEKGAQLKAAPSVGIDCSIYHGFYYMKKSGATGWGGVIGKFVEGATGYYAGIYIEGGVGLAAEVYDNLGSHTHTLGTTVVIGTWYWLEVLRKYKDYEFYVDGDLKWTYAGEYVITPSYFRSSIAGVALPQRHLIDLVRTATKEEYPPE
jgi:hypothetical protein